MAVTRPKPTLLYVTPGLGPPETGPATRAGPGGSLRGSTASLYADQSFDSGTPRAPSRAHRRPHMVASARDAWHDRSFDLVHVFRLSSATARHWLTGAGRAQVHHLDLDDIESKTTGGLPGFAVRTATIGLREDEVAWRSEMLEMAAYRRLNASKNVRNPTGTS